MGQAERGIPEVAAVEPAESIGSYLARQRRLRGIEIEELSRATRIPVRSLLRLESGAFDADPDGFVRGFVRTVADALGLPPDETIARMLPEASGEAEPRSRRFGSRGLRAALLLAALAAIGGVVWLAGARGGLSAAHFPSRNALVVRRDAVRALAAERGIFGPEPDVPLPASQAPEGRAQRGEAERSQQTRPQAAAGGAQRGEAERSQQLGERSSSGRATTHQPDPPDSSATDRPAAPATP